MKPSLFTKQAIEDIATNVYLAARENAWDTVPGPKADEKQEFVDVFQATAEGIIDSYLGDPRWCGEYGLPEPLTQKQKDTIRAFLVKGGYL